jgi:DNA-binding transcriptional regulator YiaG
LGDGVSTDVSKLIRARWLARSGEGRRIRERAGLSLREVADAVGVDPTTLARWEHDRSVPRSRAAQRWADVIAEAAAACPDGGAAA